MKLRRTGAKGHRVVTAYADGDRDFDALMVELRMICSVVVGRLSMSVDEALG